MPDGCPWLGPLTDVPRRVLLAHTRVPGGSTRQQQRRARTGAQPLHALGFRAQTITFFEEGEPLIDGEPGDLNFVVRTVPVPHWERRGHDLLINQTITLVEALTGKA